VNHQEKGKPQLGFRGWEIEKACLLCLVALTKEQRSGC
jgi:hypothetical protein